MPRALRGLNAGRQKRWSGRRPSWLRQKKELKGRSGQLRRYENFTPGRHGYNEERAKTRAEEQRMLAEETGNPIPENHKIRPPNGHQGAQNQPEWERVVEHHTKRCPRCGTPKVARAAQQYNHRL